MELLNREDIMKKPEPNEYAEYYSQYINNIGDRDIFQLLNEQIARLKTFAENKSEESANKSYQSGKWSIKEVIGHIIDTERVFAFRAMSIARGELKSLPGFDQDEYVKNANFNSRTLKSLIEEFENLRLSNIKLISSFDDEVSKRVGVANNYTFSVRAVVYGLVGHAEHHINVLNNFYKDI